MELIRRGLEGLAANLMIDKEWSVWGERSLTWVGHRLCQEFVATGPLHDAGYTLVRLSASVPVVREVTLDSAKVVEILGNLNQMGVGEALVWDASHRTILSCTGVTAHEASMDWRIGQLGAFAIISLTLAEGRAEMLAELFQGAVAEWSHPTSGRRQVPDDMLNALEGVFVRAGTVPSHFARADEFHDIADIVRNGPFFSAGGSSGGIAIEVAVGEDDTSLIHMQAAPSHPVLGSGLLVTTQFRVPPHFDFTCADLAGYLNVLEARGDLLAPSYGAWCVDPRGPQDVLAHALFVPNQMYRPGVSRDLAAVAIRRAQWAAEALLAEGGKAVRSALPAVMRRMGVEGVER